MTKIISFLFLFIGINSYSQINISQNDIMDISHISNSYGANKNNATKEMKLRYAINTIQGQDYLSILLKVNQNFSVNSLENIGALVGGKVNDIVSVKYPLTELSNIFTLEGVVTLQVADKVKPLLNKVLWDIHADSVHQGIGLSQAYTGKDVLIGITDWGFDYTHPNFYDTLLNATRILAAWDQFKTSGPTPLGYNYGTEYSNPTDLLNAGSDTANIYSYHYHGSHVAGICGGGGVGTSFRGLGYESQFLFTTFLVDEASVLDAWQWMYDKSVTEGKKLVINMSWGLYHMGANDGTSLLSQALDNFTDMGVLFVTSAGNNGNNDFHILKSFNSDELLSNITFSSTLYSQYYWGQSIHGWGDAGNDFSVGIKILNNTNQTIGESQYYSTANTINYIDSFVVVNGIADTIFFNLSMDHAYPTNGRPQMRLRVKKQSLYKVVLKSTATNGNVHYWNVAELLTDVGNWGNDFTSLNASYTAGDANYGIGAPASSNKAISVSAYGSQTNTNGGPFIGGNIASFSSKGPLINGNIKPDISAPGVSVGSSVSSFTDANFNLATSVMFNGTSYPFTRISGTSMSSPVVAGVVSLIWDANPYLAPWQVKNIISTTAREDIKTGTLPSEGDSIWGHGKINAYQAVILALNTVGVNESKKDIQWSIFPNPTNNIIKFNNLPNDVTQIYIYDINGKVCLSKNVSSQKQDVQINVSSLLIGTYVIKVISNYKVEQRKFIIIK